MVTKQKKLNIKTLTGHLTQTEKKAITAILNAKLLQGRVGRKDYFITKKGDKYTVNVFQIDRGFIPDYFSEKRLSKYTHTFTIK